MDHFSESRLKFTSCKMPRSSWCKFNSPRFFQLHVKFRNLSWFASEEALADGSIWSPLKDPLTLCLQSLWRDVYIVCIQHCLSVEAKKLFTFNNIFFCNWPCQACHSCRAWCERRRYSLDTEGGQRIHWRRRRPKKSDIWQTNSASRYNAGRTLDISTGSALKRDQTTLPSSVSTRVRHWVKVSPNFLPNFIELLLLLLLSVTPRVPLWLKRQSQEVLRASS